MQPIAKQKHFLVSKVITLEIPEQPIELVEIESVYSKKTTRIAWRDLMDTDRWIQGWK
ncbi:TIGR02450 family Trp-rich protein [Polynucleobacter necessarius]|uniref:TIGR02450 family Trp-rich protein n=1 Tax=Polynucleobacter necessarius TaxID=576610 RepID=UPI001E45F797|nr:TIGR02450 family Trp-rich protein [Polynucleobacter necessarius]